MPEDSGTPPLGTLVAEGYLAPRRSMARVLALRPDEPTRLLMVGIGIVVGALGFALFGQTGAEARPGSVIFGYVVSVMGGLFQYYGFAWFIGFVARALGGEGGPEADRTLVAWWALVTAPLPVAMVAAIRAGDSPLAGLVLFVAGILSIVLLAAYITEAHRFRSTAAVCGAMIALLTILSMVFGSLIPLPA